MANEAQVNKIGFMQNQAAISGYLADNDDYRAEFADQPWAFQNPYDWTNDQVDDVIQFLRNKINSMRRI